MTDDREPFEQARAAGLRARHETRLARAQENDPETRAAGEAFDKGMVVDPQQVPMSLSEPAVQAGQPAAIKVIYGNTPRREAREAAIRKAVSEEIARAVEVAWMAFDPPPGGAEAGMTAAAIAREIGAKE